MLKVLAFTAEDWQLRVRLGEWQRDECNLNNFGLQFVTFGRFGAPFGDQFITFGVAFCLTPPWPRPPPALPRLRGCDSPLSIII